MATRMLFVGVVVFGIFCHCILEYILQYSISDIPIRYVQSLTRKSVVESSASSIWCHSVDTVFRCTFKNLYYVPKEKQFIFVLSKDSIISGIRTKEEMKSIQLSSVVNHNLLTMNIAIVSNMNKVINRKRVRHGTAFILWRFKWDNIMHVLHDDLVPLYFTYASLCAGSVEECINKYRLAFVDEGEAGELSEWYRLFSNAEPLFLHKEESDSLICFEEAQTGLLRTSIWFQYGFGIPQGPLTNLQINGNMLQQFTDFVLRKFGLSKEFYVKDHMSVLVFSRKLNRRMINQDYLENVLSDSYHHLFPERASLHIVSMDLATNDTISILSAVTSSDIVVGMHGSAMILCLFLQPGSTVVELFPFGINPQYVSPVKAWTELSGVGIIYKSWENKNEYNSYPHPNAPPLLGGIKHLSETEQEQIKATKIVPAVECCHNATYLYRMFQDTLIDLHFIAVFKQALQEHQQFSLAAYTEECKSRMFLQYAFPAPVSNITCASENKVLQIMWSPPINLEPSQLLYKVAVVSSSGLQLSLTSRGPQLTIQLPAFTVGELLIDVWIKSTVQEEESIDVHAKCQINVF